MEFDSPEAEIRVRRDFLSNSLQCKLALTVAASVLSKMDKKPFALNISTELSLGSLSSNILMQRI